ncbi:MAG: PD-(D/E)XK nuclease family protein [Nanoarchaeota archaeon]
MPIYSHSRLQTFEQCKLKFKFEYIDKVETEIEDTAEAFLGTRVHETLQKLYKDLKLGKKDSLAELHAWYDGEWERNWNDKVLIVREGLAVGHYRALGRKFISDYYARYDPFDQEQTISTEQRVLIEAGPYQLQGYIDRLSTTKEGVYIIHDYKTGQTLPTTADLEKERQLKLYAIAIRQLYQDCAKVKLVWHYLAFDKELVYEPKPHELELTQQQVIEIIKKLESTTEFPPQSSRLCDWCAFQRICPEWKHKFAVAQKELQDFFLDDGVALVNRYVEATERKERLDAEVEALKEKLCEFAEKKGLTAVFGSGHKAIIRSYPKLSFPKKEDPHRRPFEEALRKIGLFDRIAQPDVYELAKMMNNHEVHPELAKLLEPFIEKGKTIRIYLNKI